MNEMECKIEAGTGHDKKTSAEIQRETEIQALLDRPRVMDGAGDGSDVRFSRSSSGNLTSRKFSLDVGHGEAIEMTGPLSAVPPRRSVDIAEVLRLR